MQQQSQRQTDTSDFIEFAEPIQENLLIDTTEIVRGQKTPEREQQFWNVMNAALLLEVSIGMSKKDLTEDVYANRGFTSRDSDVIYIWNIVWGVIGAINITLSFTGEQVSTFFTFLSFMALIGGFLLYRYANDIRQFSRQVNFLLQYNDMRSLPLLVRLAYETKDKNEQSVIYLKVQRLLESMTKQDTIYFSAKYEKYLCALTKKQHVRREYPELMQAVIIALYTLYTEETKNTLKKLASEKPRRHEEQWIPKAAQSCLERMYNP
jgi:hypothetical protein